MTKQDWQEILDQNDLHDVLINDDYNENYAISISLNVKEIRQIADLSHNRDLELEDSQKRFEELFSEKNFAGIPFIKHNIKAQTIWDWFNNLNERSKK